jgi:uncharacterized surface protein with fasciclin (FAS1) repeats
MRHLRSCLPEQWKTSEAGKQTEAYFDPYLSVVAGKVMAQDVVKLHEAKTINGQDVKIMVEDGKVMINNAKVIKTDIQCTNGVIHVIDTVLLPQ